MRVRRPSLWSGDSVSRLTLSVCGEERKELLLPTQDAEAGSTLYRGKPHIALADNAYLYYCYWSPLSSHMHRAIARVRAIGYQAQNINRHQAQQLRMKHHLMIGTWYVPSSKVYTNCTCHYWHENVAAIGVVVLGLQDLPTFTIILLLTDVTGRLRVPSSPLPSMTRSSLSSLSTARRSQKTSPSHG